MDATKNGSNKPVTKQQLTEAKQVRALLMEECRIARLKREFKILESVANVPDWTGNYQAYLERFKDDGEWWIPIAGYKYDHKAGQNFPFWITDIQHSLLRAQSRLCVGVNSYAAGILDGLASFVVAEGFTYRVTPKREGDEDNAEIKGYIDKAQDIIEEFKERVINGNEDTTPQGTDNLEVEMFKMCRIDGEMLLRVDQGEDGKTWCREALPEQMVQPVDTTYEEWSYGIKTPIDDPQKYLEFNLQYVNEPSSISEQLTPDRLFFYRVNVPRAVKRGLPDFAFGTYDALMSATKLRRNMGEGAAIQAALVAIRQHAQSSAAQIQSFVDSLPEFQRTEPFSGRTTSTQKYDSGTILDIGAGLEYKDPPAASNAAQHIEILNSLVRSALVKWNAPDWLGLADPSANTYDNALAVNSHFVKRIIREQGGLKRFFKRLMLIVLAHAIKADLLPAKVLDLIDVQVEATNPTSHDTLKSAQEDQIYVGMGVKSVQTVQQDLGLDSEQEIVNKQEWEDRFGQAMQLPLPPEKSEAGIDSGTEAANDERGNL